MLEKNKSIASNCLVVDYFKYNSLKPFYISQKQAEEQEEPSTKVFRILCGFIC